MTKLTPTQNFLRWVDKTDTCWLWTGGKDYGYGRFYCKFDGKTWRAHRYSYALFIAPIERHMVIDHLCKNPSCVNPEHLEKVTHKENTMRGISFSARNARKTHCKRGHEFTDENTYGNNNRRFCRRCLKQYREDNKEFYSRYHKEWTKRKYVEQTI